MRIPIPGKNFLYWNRAKVLLFLSIIPVFVSARRIPTVSKRWYNDGLCLIMRIPTAINTVLILKQDLYLSILSFSHKRASHFCNGNPSTREDGAYIEMEPCALLFNWNPIVEIRWYNDGLIWIMGILYKERLLYVETGHCTPSTSSLSQFPPKMGQSHDHLIFIMRISRPGKIVLILKQSSVLLPFHPACTCPTK